MKKILFLLALTSFSLFGMAQSFSHTTSNPTGAINNASSDTMSYSTVKNYSVVGIQPVITKATGTMAGTSVLYGSLDGINFIAVGDTLTNTNVTTNSTVWSLSNPPYIYYRIITSGATTVTGTTVAKFIGKK